MNRSLYLASEALRLSGILLQPFMPTKSRELLDELGVDPASGRGWHAAEFGKGGVRRRRVAVSKDRAGTAKGGLWPPVVAGVSL